MIHNTQELISWKGPENRQKIFYMIGDSFDEHLWMRFKEEGLHFNLILSDGTHNYDAVKTEWYFLQKYDLLDLTKDFVYWFDDIGTFDTVCFFSYFLFSS